jgi:hypothetical protein
MPFIARIADCNMSGVVKPASLVRFWVSPTSCLRQNYDLFGVLADTLFAVRTLNYFRLRRFSMPPSSARTLHLKLRTLSPKIILHNFVVSFHCAATIKS